MTNIFVSYKPFIYKKAHHVQLKIFNYVANLLEYKKKII